PLPIDRIEPLIESIAIPLLLKPGVPSETPTPRRKYVASPFNRNDKRHFIALSGGLSANSDPLVTLVTKSLPQSRECETKEGAQLERSLAPAKGIQTREYKLDNPILVTGAASMRPSNCFVIAPAVQNPSLTVQAHPASGE